MLSSAVPTAFLAAGLLATDRVAVDREPVYQHFRMLAVRLGALPTVPGVADQGAVTVRLGRQALAAFFAHRLFIAPGERDSGSRHGIRPGRKSAGPREPGKEST